MTRVQRRVQTKAYKAIRSLIDKNILQKSIDNMVEWSDIWQIGFNGSKCKVLHIGKNNHAMSIL